jgi:uncharacterized protein involved in exopolysaccharide biosynthesis
LDIASVLVRRKRLILGMTVIVGLLVFAYAYLTRALPPTHPLNLLPDMYAPKVDVLLRSGSSDAGSMSSLLSQSGLGSVAGLLGGGSAGNGTSADLAQYLLDTDLIRDEIAEEFGFVERYGLDRNPRTSARGRVKSALEYEYDGAAGVLSISYRDTDKAFATDVVNRVAQILETQFRGITLRSVEDKRRDLEARLQGAEDDLQRAVQVLIDYSVAHGIVNIETQAEIAAEQTSIWRGELLQKQLELNNMIRAGRSQDDPLVQRLQDEAHGLQQLIRESEQGWQTFQAVTIPERQLPRVIAEYARLKNDVSFRQVVYTTIWQSYEQTRLDEKDQTSQFQVIRYAEVPELKSGPSRAKICIIATVSAFFLAVLLAFMAEYVDRARHDPEESHKLSEIRRSLLDWRSPRRSGPRMR